VIVIVPAGGSAHTYCLDVVGAIEAGRSRGLPCTRDPIISLQWRHAEGRVSVSITDRGATRRIRCEPDSEPDVRWVIAVSATS